MTTSAETVSVRFPLRIWGRLASEAENRDMRIADVLVAAAVFVTRRSHRTAVVAGLALAGHSDRVIAELTGETREFVSSARRGAGLPANPEVHDKTTNVEIRRRDA